MDFFVDGSCYFRLNKSTINWITYGMNVNKFLIFLKKGDNRTQTVKKNAFGAILIKGFSILIQLMLVPLTLGYLSSELYGIWLTLSSVLLWLNFFDVGFTLGLKNKLAESIALGEYHKGQSLVSTTYFMMIVIFVPLCLILECIVPVINWSSFLNVNPTYNEQLVDVMQILVVCFCLQMILNVLSAVLSAYQKVALASALPVIGNFLALIVIYLLTRYTEPSLKNMALSVSYLPIFVFFVCSIIFFRGKLKLISPSVKAIDFSLVRNIFSLGIKFFIIQIQMIVLYQSTNILISNISSPLDVTSYNIAYKYMGIASMMFSIILGPLWPAFTDAYAKKDYKWMNSVYRQMMRLYGLILVVVIVMMIVSPIIYDIWFNSKVFIPYLMTISVGIYVLIHAWDSLQVALINGIGCVTLQTYVTLIGLVLHIPLSLFLGKYLGALGVISSMIIINIVYSIVFTIQLKILLKNKGFGIWIK